MKRVLFSLVGRSGNIISSVYRDFDDDVTDKEIDEELKDWEEEVKDEIYSEWGETN